MPNTRDPDSIQGSFGVVLDLVAVSEVLGTLADTFRIDGTADAISQGRWLETVIAENRGNGSGLNNFTKGQKARWWEIIAPKSRNMEREKGQGVGIACTPSNLEFAGTLHRQDVLILTRDSSNSVYCVACCVSWQAQR